MNGSQLSIVIGTANSLSEDGLVATLMAKLKYILGRAYT